MDSETRKTELRKIAENSNNVVMTGIPLKYHGEIKRENVYKIPLDYLVYNKYNGRIGAAVQSYEAQNAQLNPEIESDRDIIEKFLFESKEERNQKTMRSLLQDGQQRYGIVTADGKIVDGNRRAMLLNRLYKNREHFKLSHKDVEHCQYFLAIILPDDASERDMQKLETVYQMGEDDKVDYNSIEKYLKCKALKEYFTTHDIAEFMGEKESKIKEWLDILTLMEEYLDSYGYKSIYTRLEKTEGPFVDLNGYLNSYKKRGANISNMDWEFDDSDLADLKLVCFDYIRARYEGKEFRDIAKTGIDGSIFFFKDLWQKFLAEHQSISIEEESVDDLKQKYPKEDLSQLLRSRDIDWKNKIENNLKGNLKKHTSKLDDKRDANQPQQLLEKAFNALNSIDIKQKSFYEIPEVEQLVKDINSIIWEMKKLLDRKCKQ